MGVNPHERADVVSAMWVLPDWRRGLTRGHNTVGDRRMLCPFLCLAEVRA